jgi:hypothetical protein
MVQNLLPRNIIDTSRFGLLLQCLKKSPLPESASELYRPSGRRLSAKLVSKFADKECYMVSVTDPYGRILGFIDRSR